MVAEVFCNSHRTPYLNSGKTGCLERCWRVISVCDCWDKRKFTNYLLTDWVATYEVKPNLLSAFVAHSALSL